MKKFYNILDTMEEIKYIKCGCCDKKYIYDVEHIKLSFGYNPKGDVFKNCVSCRDRNKKYYQDNKTSMKEQSKERHRNNREYNLERDKQYREEHKEQIKERRKKYREANKEKLKESRKTYREANKKELYEKFNQRRRAKKELLREEAKNSNGTMNCCGTCIKLKTIDNFKFRNGKTYDICRKCALVRYDTKDLRAEFESGCGGFD
jgi:primosomal protein N'